jgi:hypothetical protein
MFVAILIVWGVLSAFGIKADVHRVREILGYVVLAVVLATWAINGLIKLAAVIRSPAPLSHGAMPAPFWAEDGKPPALVAAPLSGATLLAPGVTPCDQDREGAQWWLARAGRVSGPYATASVVADARAGRFNPDVQICQVGGEHWILISLWLKERAPSGAV